MKYLKLILAVVVTLLFLSAQAADAGFSAQILSTFGEYRDLVVALLISYLVLPMLDDAL